MIRSFSCRTKIFKWSQLRQWQSNQTWYFCSVNPISGVNETVIRYQQLSHCFFFGFDNTNFLSYFINGSKNSAWHFFSPAGSWAINYSALNLVGLYSSMISWSIHRTQVLFCSWKHLFQLWLLWLLNADICS